MREETASAVAWASLLSLTMRALMLATIRLSRGWGGGGGTPDACAHTTKQDSEDTFRLFIYFPPTKNPPMIIIYISALDFVNDDRFQHHCNEKRIYTASDLH